jgi:hypothetical protein
MARCSGRIARARSRTCFRSGYAHDRIVSSLACRSARGARSSTGARQRKPTSSTTCGQLMDSAHWQDARALREGRSARSRLRASLGATGAGAAGPRQMGRPGGHRAPAARAGGLRPRARPRSRFVHRDRPGLVRRRGARPGSARHGAPAAARGAAAWGCRHHGRPRDDLPLRGPARSLSGRARRAGIARRSAVGPAYALGYFFSAISMEPSHRHQEPSFRHTVRTPGSPDSWTSRVLIDLEQTMPRERIVSASALSPHQRRADRAGLPRDLESSASSSAILKDGFSTRGHWHGRAPWRSCASC